MKPREDLTGRRFGRLAVVSFAGTLRRRRAWRTWLCRCDCGMEKIVRTRELANGHTQSCGCLARERLLPSAGRNRLCPGQSSFNQLFAAYQRSAKARDIPFLLAKEEFFVLTRLACFYCQALPVQRGPTTKDTVGTYLFNGIDRVDNARGYERGNVRPCCTICNVAKSTLSEAEFFDWIARVSETCAARRNGYLSDEVEATVDDHRGTPATLAWTTRKQARATNRVQWRPGT